MKSRTYLAHLAQGVINITAADDDSLLGLSPRPLSFARTNDAVLVGRRTKKVSSLLPPPNFGRRCWFALHLKAVSGVWMDKMGLGEEVSGSWTGNCALLHNICPLSAPVWMDHPFADRPTM
ncbi:hypothetical protein D8674_000118 [Pyrus ussuriensis x Pyrus communis]|uniref:Uncharacterized protein n=1 Tax=Pyrus ussuriensis x Pyrus communis TaxID=2448454 RepID=A0A5N5F270_9ROSA|nr:hypothetical protein D8674_000118 [Pyrus ussuriensis x Pyrus communis]